MIDQRNNHHIIKKSDRSKVWIKYLGFALAVALLVSVVALYFERFDRLSTENIRAFINDYGMWAPVAFGIVYIAASPIPFVATVLSTTGGVLFGPLRGTLYTIVIASISALVPFTLARNLGQEWVATKLTGKKVESILSRTSQSYGFVLVLLTRLIPVLPWEIQNYVLGLTNVRVWNFLLGTLIGTTPGTFSLVYLGDSLTNLGPNRIWIALGLNTATLLVPVFVLLIRWMRGKLLYSNP